MTSIRTDLLLPLVTRAGEAILAYRHVARVETKEGGSPVTEADLAAERILAGGLLQIAPGVPILSEESAHAPYEERRGWETAWIVDPLDGTKEFIAGRDEFTVNVALVRGGRPVAGVVHAPALGLSWFGEVGEGAFRTGPAGKAPIRVRPRSGAPRIVASRSHLDPRTADFVGSFPGAETLQAGSSLKFCRVAEGAADLYPRGGPTMEWDVAAASAVLEAAGGSVLVAADRPMSFNRPELRNPPFLAVGDPAWLDHPACRAWFG